ncbi:MAG TPA: UvrD-helicase domain-containing protein [Candidatus Izemoplasmatales bacterium]|nr:UvrD-helicase domain-containing protein [Candidatus Izemoplasmatales bacterium]
MDWTREQELAIHHGGENILVSAGAGSGKTAVLSQRVLEKLQSGVAVDDLIILTFTNAAAADMKAKIKKLIQKDPRLSEQMKRLDNAVISTFDSFALRLVTQYHHLLGVKPDVRIVDPAVLESVRNATLDLVMKRRYREADPRFLATIDRLFDKGDKTFREAIRQLAAATEMIPDRFSWFRTYESHFFGPEQLAEIRKAFRERLARQVATVKRTLAELKEMLSACSDEKIRTWVTQLSERLDPVLSVNEADIWLTKSQEIVLPNSPRLGGEAREVWGEPLRDGWEPLKEAWNRLRNDVGKLFVSSMDEAIRAVLETKESVLQIVSTTAEYLQELEVRKRSENLFDFGDIMTMAIDLLEQHPELAASLRNRIQEILVDEYQDTNDLQDHFLSLLERDNLFMVGDVKQSIYGFRNANPQNFVRKYHDFDTRKTGRTIDLLANFRSRPEVLNGINRLFETVMDERVGGVDYQNRQALIPGLQAYSRFRVPREPYGVRILSYSVSEEESAAVSKAYREGAIIAADIRARLHGGFRVLDRQTESGRPARPEDFALLVDRKSGFEEYRKALVDAGLPVLAITDEPFLAASEIRFLGNALRLIRCYSDRQYFVEQYARAIYGVGRSFVFGIEDSTLLDAIDPLPTSIEEARGRLQKSEATRRLDDVFLGLSQLSDHRPLEETVLRCVIETGIFSRIADLEDPENVEAKVLFLVDKARQFPEFTLDDLIAYFDELNRSRDLDIEYARDYDSSVSAVRLMTMHKSKGLEFPVCYLPGLYKRFNTSSSKTFFLFDKRYGLIGKAWEDGFQETVLHFLKRDEALRETVSERIRLLYVAMTRAKEEVVLLRNETAVRSPRIRLNSQGYLDEGIRLGFSSYSDLLAAVPLTEGWVEPVTQGGKPEVVPATEPLGAERPIRYEERSYPVQARKFGIFSQSVPKIREESPGGALILGTRLHAELENFDFQHWEQALKKVSPPVRAALQQWETTPPFSQREDAVFHPEYEFEEDTPEGIRRGVIDLLVERADRIDLVDYKLKHLDEETYRRQLRGYREFVTRVTGKPVHAYLFSVLDGQWIRLGDDE